MCFPTVTLTSIAELGRLLAHAYFLIMGGWSSALFRVQVACPTFRPLTSTVAPPFWLLQLIAIHCAVWFVVQECVAD